METRRIFVKRLDGQEEICNIDKNLTIKETCEIFKVKFGGLFIISRKFGNYRPGATRRTATIYYNINSKKKLVDLSGDLYSKEVNVNFVDMNYMGYYDVPIYSHHILRVNPVAINKPLIYLVNPENVLLPTEKLNNEEFGKNITFLRLIGKHLELSELMYINSSPQSSVILLDNGLGYNNNSGKELLISNVLNSRNINSINVILQFYRNDIEKLLKTFTLDNFFVNLIIKNNLKIDSPIYLDENITQTSLIKLLDAIGDINDYKTFICNIVSYKINIRVFKLLYRRIPKDELISIFVFLSIKFDNLCKNIPYHLSSHQLNESINLNLEERMVLYNMYSPYMNSVQDRKFNIGYDQSKYKEYLDAKINYRCLELMLDENAEDMKRVIKTSPNNILMNIFNNIDLLDDVEFNIIGIPNVSKKWLDYLIEKCRDKIWGLEDIYLASFTYNHVNVINDLIDREALSIDTIYEFISQM